MAFLQTHRSVNGSKLVLGPCISFMPVHNPNVSFKRELLLWSLQHLWQQGNTYLPIAMDVRLYEEQALSSSVDPLQYLNSNLPRVQHELPLRCSRSPPPSRGRNPHASRTPTPAALPRSCTTITPTSLQQLDNTWPDVPVSRALFSGSSNLMVTHDNINASNPTHSLQLLEFSIPPSSSTCQLQITDPSCSTTFTNSTDYIVPLPVHLKVISLHQNSLPTNGSICYNDIFGSDAAVVLSWDFGDVTMSAGDTKIFNSEGCPRPTTNGESGKVWYVIDYEMEEVEGEWSEWMMLQQDGNLEKRVEMNGVYLTYC
ncbi:uncharacterized protein PAC_09551 [Phialocephala subalpina]|uniref:Ubiquitin 3 binding protein But2 C-terminal domain-containing protein n=1 Tax=Phialocephala subalpina TaxID=576137 RepID=A0A1L7X3T5_9HELO|nr:uncharacterized protein PAC_09551 [Phialocephala subalpina]